MNRLFCLLVVAVVLWAGNALAQESAAPSGPPSGSILEVEARGEGATREEALRAAFVNALQRAVGVVIHSSTTVRNFEIQEDLQRLLTNGCIETYDELSSETADGTVRVEIKARVRRGMVADFYAVSKSARVVNLDDEWARLTTSIEGRKQALELLRSMMPRIRESLYKVSLLDMHTGSEIGPSGMPTPYLQTSADGRTIAVWAALLRPDLEFWDEHAAPLVAGCLDVLSTRRGRLFVRMEGDSPGMGYFDGAAREFDGGFARAPRRLWQKIPPYGLLPWAGAPPVPHHAIAPHRIALQQRASNAEALDLRLYHLDAETHERLFAPLIPTQNPQKNPRTLKNQPLYVRATITLANGAQEQAVVGQSAPFFLSWGIPWTGAAESDYCGPFFPAGWMRSGWSHLSAWPVWEGPVLPVMHHPAFDAFVIHDGRLMRADGHYQDAFEKMIRVRRGRKHREAPAKCEFDTELIVPLVFTLDVEKLNDIRQLSVEVMKGR